jgi:hypothetical protein
MGQEVKHLLDEPDIGSGEKTPGQQDVERDERSVHVPSPQAGHPQNGSQFPQVVEEQKYAEQRPTPEEQRPRHGDQQSGLPGRVLRSGDHIARIATAQLPDRTYEAQVYVRLTREPETAETYIPAGTFVTEAEAWAAAEERANRAFREHEF